MFSSAGTGGPTIYTEKSPNPRLTGMYDVLCAHCNYRPLIHKCLYLIIVNV